MGSIPETIEIGRLRYAFVAMERSQTGESYAAVAESVVAAHALMDSDMRDAFNRSLAPHLEELSLGASQGITDPSLYYEIDVLLEFFYRWAHARFAFKSMTEAQRSILNQPRVAPETCLD